MDKVSQRATPFPALHVDRTAKIQQADAVAEFNDPKRVMGDNLLAHLGVSGMEAGCLRR